MQSRCWPTWLVLWPYAGISFALIQGQHPAFADSMHWQVWVAVGALLCLVNVICALRRKAQTALIGMIAKLLLIPFYVISFFFGLILFAAFPMALIILFLLDGMYMLTTSAYTLRSLYLAWRGGTLSTGRAIALAVSQCIFVLDVPCSIAIYAIEKRRSH